ncbi:MAG: 2-C-methyl-D-erythritol 4-phosphate cytidylyltransferase [Paludibacteraceae bacterium]|nr:2-C-methyl-D-erythritol 4-phosphate cytidylyltransferase [Paludibacteraceae bacterium]
MKNIAIILAGGIGSRVGGKTPKQLLPLEDGRSVLEHSIDAFEQASCIDEIAVVMHPDWVDEAVAIVEKNKWEKVAKIIPGGSERWESSWHAILAYNDPSASEDEYSVLNLWFHDAARPFVSQRILADVAQALETHDAVTVAVPVTDTLYRIESGKSVEGSAERRVAEVPQRSDYMRAQTPQAFRYDVVFGAYAKALAEDAVIATDDAGIVRKYEANHKIYIVSGEETNRKITYPEDLTKN